MEGNEDSNNNKSETSQSSEEPPDMLATQNHYRSSREEGNTWQHLKTITTFDSGASNHKVSNEQHHHQNERYTSNLSSSCKLEKCTYDKTMSDKKYQREMINYDFEMNVSVSTANKNTKAFTKASGKISLPVEPPRRQRRTRRRSQSNSLSEGHMPYGAVADPVSHFSISSNPPRNGVMSDVGVDCTSNSLRSCAPSPVQSLTRFSPTSLLVESLIDQLCKLVEKDAGKQRKLYNVICQRLHQMQLIDDTYTIEEFQFMRSHYQKALYQFLAVAKSSTQSCDTRNILLPLPSSTMNVDLKLSSEQVLEWSRYKHEYQELEYIAKGGFGHVYKVKNKLDGGEYAIKKIYLRYRYVEGFLRSLKEVKMLARLNHPNIVSYKAAWLEPSDENRQKCSVQKPPRSSTSLEASLSIFSVNSNSRLPLPPAPVNISEDSLDIVFQDSSPDSKSSCNQSPKASKVPAELSVDNRKQGKTLGSRTHPLGDILGSSFLSCTASTESTSQNSSSAETGSSKSSGEAAICPVKTKEFKGNNMSSSILRNCATLYVQMQLCQRTLRQWLDERNASLPAYPLAPSSSEGIVALNLFRKIVRGVDYIHTQGIVHHDIKPSNIFVNENLKEVQVGDFGLSCCILSKVDSTGVFGEHHGEVGTRMYAAPEQLRGRCTAKSDLYSLGIVFLELLQPFHTDMERSKVIQKLRTGHMPPELTTVWPHAARLISDLLAISPAARPSANDLLQRVDSLLRSNVGNDVSSQLASKDETIRLLKEAVASRDQEIAELKRRLSIFEENSTV